MSRVPSPRVGKSLWSGPKAASVSDLVAATMRKRKAAVPLPDAGELLRKVGQTVGDEMDNCAFALDLAAHRHHPSGQHHSPLGLKRRPDHHVGDAGLFLERDEHDALCGPGPLPDQNKTSRLQPPPVPRPIASAQVTIRRPARSARRNSTGCRRRLRPTYR
jgi:hypothetical protein